MPTANDESFPAQNMKHTHGVWIRDNKKTKQTELWYEGECHFAWDTRVSYICGDPFVSTDLATAMIAMGVVIGKSIRSKEIKKLING